MPLEREKGELKRREQPKKQWQEPLGSSDEVGSAE